MNKAFRILLEVLLVQFSLQASAQERRIFSIQSTMRSFRRP